MNYCMATVPYGFAGIPPQSDDEVRTFWLVPAYIRHQNSWYGSAVTREGNGS